MGRSDLFLKLEIYKKLLALPIIFVGILFGMMPMLYMILFSSVLAFFINSPRTVVFPILILQCQKTFLDVV